MSGSDDVDIVRVYRATVVPVFRYLSKMTGGDRALAEDLTQEVYASALRVARDGRSEPVSLPWLLVTARNAYLQRLRSSSRRERREALVSRRTPPTVTSFDTQVVDADLARRLLAALSPDQRAAFVLRYVDDLPVREIAGLMGRSARAVESLLVRANARMQAGAAVGGGR